MNTTNPLVDVEKLEILAKHLDGVRRVPHDIKCLEEKSKEMFFDMLLYAQTLRGGCKTAGCIAGHTVMIFDPAAFGNFISTPERARDILRLSMTTAEGLFTPDSYLLHAHADIMDYSEINPRMAAQAVRNVIKGDSHLPNWTPVWMWLGTKELFDRRHASPWYE